MPTMSNDPRPYIQIAARIRQNIAEGAPPPGEPAPSITQLAAETGHARQTCAKALQFLEAEGLLTRYPGVGYYVTAPAA